ncbi:unnamed protein product [Paramecium sonneborni]|uniref:Peptidase M16 C-terminal domain-containing protein n=1 Tax=Paramecium sonneborni TaxID=65129 RepID=A0A8S1N299_9CILI|nr:unnamed protein product [Paramecium sonneborni]
MMNQLRKAKFSTITQYQIRGVFKQQLKEGEIYSNFKVDEFYRSRDFQTLCYNMHHIETNTNYIHFATNSVINQGALIFKTPAIDNSGIPHIVQQILTCGSQKYPVRDAWSHMRGRSLQPSDLVPYVGTDHTTFQVQSALFEDLKQLFNLTFEQVFRPMFREVDFLQQIRVQVLGGNELILRGIVYDQMIKQFEQPEFIHAEAVRKHLLNGTVYQYTTGGIPKEMTNATYEICQQYYKDYIHLSNAYIVTVGDIDVLQYCQYFDQLIKSHQNSIIPIKQLDFQPVKLFEPRLLLRGQPSFSFAYRTANLTETPEDYFKLGILSFLLHDIQDYGLRPILEKYGQYCLNYGADMTLHNQIIQFGFNNKESEQELYNFIKQLTDNIYQVIPQNIINIALDRIRLRRSINIQDLIPYIINKVKPSIYLNQECKSEDFQSLIQKYFSQDKCTINMEPDQYYIEDMNLEIKQHLKQLQVNYQKLSEQQKIIEEDTDVLSLESLPQLNAANIIPLLKQKNLITLDLNFNVPCSIFAAKHPQQSNIKWIIDVSQFSQKDYETICILKDLLPEFFNKQVSQHDVECFVIEDKFIIELICLDKNIQEAFQQFQLVTDPALDNLELISQSLSIISANYLSNEDITQIAISYSQQEKYPIIQQARKICQLEVEILKNYSAKQILEQLSQKLIACFYKIMNKNIQSFEIYSNPLLKDKLQSQLNLLLTNIKLQFDDYLMNKIEFEQKYEIIPFKQEFQYLKLYVALNTHTNCVTETIQIAHKPANYVLSNLLTHIFIPQYCNDSQLGYCQYNPGKLTFYTINDIHTLKTYRIFENSVHLLLECLDQDNLNSAKLGSFNIDDPEKMQQILAVSEEEVKEQAQYVLNQMAEGQTSQVIFGKQVQQLDEYVKRGWTIERYINEVAV